MRLIFSATVILLFLNNPLFAQTNYTQFVNPFIGTGGHGHTYPGATVPHGMVQLSPDTRLEGWDGCGGYHYSDNYIYGFTHTHLSGTGVSDYGDILLMPTTSPSPYNTDYGSTFSHANEKATPGFYQVYLQRYKINAELTASERVGFHHYTFNDTTINNYVEIDLVHRDMVLESYLKIEDSFTISGLRRSKAWAVNQYVYFTIKFSSPILDFGYFDDKELSYVKVGSTLNSKKLRAFFKFKAKDVYAKVAISPVSIEGAKRNLAAEIPDWNFDKVKKDAEQKWNTELGKIEVESNDINKKTIFYTALYHTQIVPCINMDVDGQYRGMDNEIHTAKDFTYYSVFSLWDTYRAAHPLYNIIDRERNLDYIKTFLVQYQQGGRLPVWELSSNETDCMIGYHSVSVIADAYAKGIRGFDTDMALEAMKKSANWNHFGLPALQKKGVIEMGDENESVSKLLEYAYDDWCIATFAKAIGKEEDYKNYFKRSQYWKNIFDTKTGFMRPRKNGDWLNPFEPREVNNNFTEGNSWQYSFYVPQDMDGFIKMLGGKEALEKKLDALFAAPQQTTGREQSDITGLIGQYAHGNEPSHHIAYLYNYTNNPWKCQEKINFICNNFYKDDPDGLIGNEDCGQMSAWYVMSALGIYSVLPGSENYKTTTPQFEKSTIHLENGKSVVISAENFGGENKFVEEIQIKDSKEEYGVDNFIPFDVFRDNSMITFTLTNEKRSNANSRKITRSSKKPILLVINPTINGGDIAFKNNKIISISSPQKDVKIYYTIDGAEPTEKSILYTKPILISSSTNIKAIAINAANEKSFVTTAMYKKQNKNWKLALQNSYETHYDGGGNNALIDGINGDINWRKGNWQGYQNNSMVAIVDLGKVQTIKNVGINCLQDVNAWIIYPKSVLIDLSIDGKNYINTAVLNSQELLATSPALETKLFEATFNAKARYVKITAIQYGALPTWHLGAGGQSHIFVDEIEVK